MALVEIQDQRHCWKMAAQRVIDVVAPKAMNRRADLLITIISVEDEEYWVLISIRASGGALVMRLLSVCAASAGTGAIWPTLAISRERPHFIYFIPI